MIKWIPGSEDLFIAIFKNGAVVVMDKERDDQTFVIPECDSPFNAFRPHKSTKYNPVSFWKVSKLGLTDIAFSPDNMHLAITGVDGQLRIIDYRNERLNDIYASYFGKLTCVDWSPDGRYILTGGEDDLVTLWSFHERKMVARCEGHKSWVTGVAFDRWRCDEQTYRFGSVGEDCNLILWDFSFSALQKPKHPRGIVVSPPPVQWPAAQTQPTNIERKKSLKNHRLFRGFSSTDTTTVNNNVGTGSFGRFRKRSSKSNNIFGSSDHDFPEEQQEHLHLPVLHPPMKKNQAAILQPTTVSTIHADPCISLLFRESTLVTTDRRGRIRTWGRP
ncbi:WD40-repeat-containing domain protein [Mucor mucedo]|uniref:WD40-repeat-containing domain protein n=1 Tax=Mucor mucedo TaxID=29922 RepID=UPI002220166A|nr:WD40-repeat-containing domain protein [Mucor mucedo]KAI7888305.1 WD40-repeat-containing domain protein [Mucor mucedo]